MMMPTYQPNPFGGIKDIFSFCYETFISFEFSGAPVYLFNFKITPSLSSILFSKFLSSHFFFLHKLLSAFLTHIFIFHIYFNHNTTCLTFLNFFSHPSIFNFISWPLTPTHTTLPPFLHIFSNNINTNFLIRKHLWCLFTSLSHVPSLGIFFHPFSKHFFPDIPYFIIYKLHFIFQNHPT